MTRPRPLDLSEADWSGILDTSENGWDALYKSNLRHIYLCTQRVARGLVEQKLTGSIISVSLYRGQTPLTGPQSGLSGSR